MKSHSLPAAALALALAGCATQLPPAPPAPEETVVEGGCYNPIPDFEKLIARQATREEVELKLGSRAEKITSEKVLHSTARSAITPANLALFRRYHSASVSFMECDNQVVAFFDDTGHLVGYQAM
jgi:hypothetical protein